MKLCFCSKRDLENQAKDLVLKLKAMKVTISPYHVAEHENYVFYFHLIIKRQDYIFGGSLCVHTCIICFFLNLNFIWSGLQAQVPKVVISLDTVCLH